MGDTYMRQYMRQYNFPKRVENLRRKMRVLMEDAELISDTKALNCLKAANEAWEREVKLAELEGRIKKAMGK